jgi:Leucine-rich repeat (LRR) protein
MKSILLLLFSTALFAADPAASWIQSQGGHVVTDKSGEITAVDFSSTWITDVDLLRIGQLKSLRKLDLSHTMITDVGLEHLKDLRNITDLNLYYAEYFTDDGIAHITGWKNLERLNLHGTKVTSKVFDHLAKITSLKSLDIGFTGIDDDGFESLSSLLKLERLVIGGDRLSGSCLASLKLLPNLIDLDVSGIQWVDSGLWGLPLTPANLRQIGALTKLKSLNLNGATISDRGTDRPGSPDAVRKELKGLEALSGLVNLERLDLSRTPVDADSLAPLKALPKLRELRLGLAPKVNDAAVASLKPINVYR